MAIFSNVDEFVDTFQKAIILAGDGPSNPYAPFDVNASDYLSYALKDLSRKVDVHNLLNAIGNIKRSIDCRIDAILDYWGLYKFASKKNLSFEQKLNLVANFGMIAPSILNKINSNRNRIEHDYTVPDQRNVQDFCDIAQLFLGYTDNLIRIGIDAQIGNLDSEENTSDFADLHFMSDQSRFVINVELAPSDDKKRTSGIFTFSLKDGLEDYLKLIKWWYERI